MDPRTRFLAACRCEAVDRPPVWLMRQAGRYLSEYRELREKYDFVEACMRPDVVVEISLQPWRRFSMDAVIVFSDILLPVSAMGPRLRFEEGRGPVLSSAIRTTSDVDRLDLPHIRRSLAPPLEALAELKFRLKDEAALIGFIGAPFTLAAYMTEGGSGSFDILRRMIREEPSLVCTLIEKITVMLQSYVQEQVWAGADAIQIFDTWGGMLSEDEYRQFSLPSLKVLCEAVTQAKAVPIVFVRTCDAVLSCLFNSGATVVSIGPDIPLRNVLAKADNRLAIQGNLDPQVLLRAPQKIREATSSLLEEANGYAGYIANLGHGVLPQTRPEAVAAFVETVKEYSPS